MISTDELRTIAGYEGRYFISSSGVVYGTRGSLHARKSVEKRDGYMTIVLWKDGNPKCCRIHCLVAEAFIGPTPPGMEVNHKDTDKGHNWPENLEYVTRPENMKHAMDHGLYPIGEKHPYAKLTEMQVMEIWRRYANHESLPKISRECRVNYLTVHSIVYRKSWKRLSGGPQRSVVELVMA